MVALPTRYLLLGLCLCSLVLISTTEILPQRSLSNNPYAFDKSLRRHVSGSKYVSARGSRPGFVSAPGDGHLYLDGELFDFRSFNIPDLFDGGEFEARDLMETIAAFGSPVGRSYTLHVANSMFKEGRQGSESAHILGWDNSTNDWTYNETNWRKIDVALDQARRYGVRLIIPIINQDYGSADSDWFGNFNDLIRHRHNIQDYSEAQQAVDWFIDREMINCYKQIITFYLNRINTINGIRIGDDETILAFETGNEMNWGHRNGSTDHDRPAPAAWTIEIAQFIKTLAPKTLVMDGSYSRNPKFPWEDEVLDSPYVDLYSYHYYGEGETIPYPDMNNQVRAHRKTFIIGEHGFYERVEAWPSFYRNITCAGALVWSLRQHSVNGGFVTHGEGGKIYSYHAPGFKNQTSERFDTQEAEVISSTYDSSYTILGLDPPPKPVPGPPEAFLVSNGSHAGISWRGAAWAQEYEVLGAVFQDEQFTVILRYVPDNVDAGHVFVPLDPTDPTKPIKIDLPEPLPYQSHAGWIDTKWCYSPRSTKPCGEIHFDKEDDVSPLKPLKPMTPPKEQKSVKNSRLSPSEQTLHISGGWFSVRAISADGIPGGVSQSIFLKTKWEDHLKY
ncbi:hypothetical protein PCANC_23237 [Puccinia coronata f. sp. avenae]|uniref:mannan endo-1,4-beta-mannosidase n=1 Tax=Puccinia coronata f. sp. avenae TaxID=200324 RepID=A0A2N5TK24_9BASI|nr:hypothetical protein PCANC_26082 [Puccinia coronata f. sp. avenae]PLW25831.1 hypothetical protein PCANC_23237 [Puccinia coronata f. sp. avenae]PLW42566.1 hypothetical protein PCASD_05292 [Puccinia coronata f. sp. avenae]